MKTLAELKRDLKPDMKIKCVIHNIRPQRVGEVTTIREVRQSGFMQDNGRFIEFPLASLLDYDGKTFTVYSTGERDLTEYEKEMLDKLHNCYTPEDSEADAYTDTNICYYKEQSFARDNDVEYLLGFNYHKGLKYNFNTGRMLDNKLKGIVYYAFEIMGEDE